MMVTTEMKKADSAFYREVCLLRILAKMGYLDHKALKDIAQIAAVDYGSSLVLDKSFFSPFS